MYRIVQSRLLLRALLYAPSAPIVCRSRLQGLGVRVRFPIAWLCPIGAEPKPLHREPTRANMSMTLRRELPLVSIPFCATLQKEDDRVTLRNNRKFASEDHDPRPR
jgi:hypothetical protein